MRQNPLNAMLWLFGYTIPMILSIALIVSLRSGDSTTQRRDAITPLLMPPSVEIR